MELEKHEHRARVEDNIREIPMGSKYGTFHYLPDTIYDHPPNVAMK